MDEGHGVDGKAGSEGSSESSLVALRCLTNVMRSLKRSEDCVGAVVDLPVEWTNHAGHSRR